MTAIAWTHAGPSILAAFLASAVEFVEALTVILAVGTVRGWRDTLSGAAAALGVLLVVVAIFGAALAQVPLGILQTVVGALLLLFGLRWLRKAILHAARVIPSRDEAAAFANQVKAMRHHRAVRGWDRVAFGTAFQITILEGVEVVFIVVAFGASGAGLLLPASLGALAALLLVVALGLLVHRPLSHIPENGLKFVVGVLLSAFGAFWFGEGTGIGWRGSDWAITALVAGFLIVALLSVRTCRGRPQPGDSGHRQPGDRTVSRVMAILRKGFGLLVDDGPLAAATVAWLLLTWAILPRLVGDTAWGGPILFAGLAMILAESAIRHSRSPG